jgi:hypothetical protein
MFKHRYGPRKVYPGPNLRFCVYFYLPLNRTERSLATRIDSSFVARPFLLGGVD